MSTYKIFANGQRIAKSHDLGLAIEEAQAYLIGLDPDKDPFPTLTLVSSDESGVVEREIEL